MKQWWWITWKRQIAVPSFFLILIAILLLAFAMRTQGGRHEGIVQILLCCGEKEGSVADSIRDSLVDLSNPVIRFEACDDEDELRERVTRDESQGGYIFPEGFDRDLSQCSRVEELITVVRSDVQDNSRIVDEIVFAQLYEILGVQFAEQYADREFGSTDERRTKYIRAQYDRYKQDDIPFRFELPDGSAHPLLDGDLTKTTEKTTGQPIVGLIGILTTLASLSAGLMWYRDRERGVFTWLTPAEKSRIHMIYVGIPTFVAGFIGMIAVYVLGANSAWWVELLRMIWFVCVLSCLSLLMQSVINSPGIYIGCIPVCVFINLLGGGVFSELDEIRGIAVIKMFVPLSTYMDLPYGGRAPMIAGIYLTAVILLTIFTEIRRVKTAL